MHSYPTCQNYDRDSGRCSTDACGHNAPAPAHPGPWRVETSAKTGLTVIRDARDFTVIATESALAARIVEAVNAYSETTDEVAARLQAQLNVRADLAACREALEDIAAGDERPGHVNRMSIGQAAKIARALLARLGR